MCVSGAWQHTRDPLKSLVAVGRAMRVCAGAGAAVGLATRALGVRRGVCRGALAVASTSNPLPPAIGLPSDPARSAAAMSVYR